MNAATARPLADECMRTWRRLRDAPYRETLVLRDGRRVTLRPMHRSDAPALRHFFFNTLSPRMRILRFHGMVNDLPDEALRALTTQIPQRHVALAAMTTTDDGMPHLLAEARYAVDEEGEPELAVSVADAWQGQGLGRALVQRLATHARTEGFAVLNGTVVPGNERMLRLLKRLGAELREHVPEVKVRWVL